MRVTRRLITLGVFLSAFLLGEVALANGPSVSDSASSNSALAAPKLTVATNGTQVNLSWSKVNGATGYTLCYSLPPYTTIGNVPMGTQTSMSITLWCGAAFYVAVQAYDNVESGGYSNIQHVSISLCNFKNSLGQEFNLISAGTFTMGSPSNEPGRYNNETQHQVTLTQPFYMQTTEVTQAQWEAVMGNNPSHFSGCPTCSVENVSWDDVQLYITQMNTRGEGTYSLPTEAQWEYAARAGSTTAFSNGGMTGTECNLDSNLDIIGWYCANSDHKTHAVGQKSPNVWGLYDMSGNVWELCHDWYGSYPSSAVTNPAGASSGSDRVSRGGDFGSFAEDCRSAIRGYSSPDYRRDNQGFRLLRQP